MGAVVGAVVGAMGGDERRLRRRLRFDEVADTYARVRPGYPDAVIDDVWRLGAVPRAARVLEIGCGTGQATLPLLRRGASVLAVEIGPALAELAREVTAGYGDRVDVVTADFDDWNAAADPFELVVVATAFHWLDPATRCQRIGARLQAGGTLAVLCNEHVSDDAGDEFFVRSQTAYREAFGGTHRGFPAITALQPMALDEDVFQRVAHRTYPWTQSFDSESYLDTLSTYSDHRDLPEAQRKRLFDRLAAIIEAMGGTIDKRWATSLTLARRR